MSPSSRLLNFPEAGKGEVAFFQSIPPPHTHTSQPPPRATLLLFSTRERDRRAPRPHASQQQSFPAQQYPTQEAKNAASARESLPPPRPPHTTKAAVLHNPSGRPGQETSRGNGDPTHERQVRPPPASSSPERDGGESLAPRRRFPQQGAHRKWEKQPPPPPRWLAALPRFPQETPPSCSQKSARFGTSRACGPFSAAILKHVCIRKATPLGSGQRQSRDSAKASLSLPL
ncbi:Hypothetical predicted protein [Podarcis lilfordi]|uniref:Uncharacterized protein n=1 Tax=Podarcis lilfordi TaxID=74358 RepID=A0AA35PCA6_9SAUR|nr:Hypothetical predicted protein [Podarcis lilfordi]